MRKSLVFVLSALFSILALSFVSAHEVYYDDHHHYNTVPVSRVYYSNYDDRYYVPQVRIVRIREIPVFVGPHPRYYGHGYQDVYFRLDHYDRDYYRNYRYRDYDYRDDRNRDYNNRYESDMHPFYDRY